MKIVTIIGARPQFIKAAALSREFKRHPSIQEIIIHTGQHFDANMSDIFFSEMEIPHPNYHLEIHGVSHGAMTGRMMEKIEEVLIEEKPDLVLVYGDTNSTLAGALTAKKLHIKVAHVEAGLRSFNMQMPEEINRILTDRISDFLFCPTLAAMNNLKNEGFESFNSVVTHSGDVMEDAALFYASKALLKPSIVTHLGFDNKDFILATIHRAENTDNKTNLTNIISALNKLNDTTPVIVPMHPRTSKIISSLNIPILFKVIEPVGYFEMIQLMSHCKLIITDSGGLQKEAFMFGKYCITVREESEWVELIENGYNYLAGTDVNRIGALASELLTKPFPTKQNLYGNGKASSVICETLLKHLIK